MMTDLERLHIWINKRDMSLYALARELTLLYNSVWVMAVKNKGITDRFVIHFIRRYGYEEARSVFQDCLAPIPPHESV